MHGVKIPENLADEMPDDQDLPYLEMLYKFVFGKKSYYHLASTRHVEPQANIERMSEEEGTTDRHDMREMERGRKLKKPTGESHLLPGFGFVNESEDGADIYIILTYSRILSIGY